MLIKDLIREAIQILRTIKGSGDTSPPLKSKKLPRDDINVGIPEIISLVAHGLGMDKSTLYMRYNDKVDNCQVATVLELVNRRAKSEPLEYITGKVNFMGLEFCVFPPVFIPRPETEVLVEEAIKIVQNSKFKIQNSTQIIFDICTGSGVIGIGIAKLLPSTIVYVSDIIDLKLAKLNTTKHGVSDRIHFIRGDLLTPFKQAKADIIISNPPYIPTAQIQDLQPEIKLFEPYEALDGGKDGMVFIRLLIREASEYLKNPNGTLILEISPEQKEKTSEEAMKYFETVEIVDDFCATPRVLIASTPFSAE